MRTCGLIIHAAHFQIRVSCKVLSGASVETEFRECAALLFFRVGVAALKCVGVGERGFAMCRLSRKGLMAVAGLKLVGLLVIAFLAASVYGDAIQAAVKEREYLDAMNKELDRRAQRTAPQRTTLKVTANGQAYYVDAVDPGHEYNTIDDIMAAQKKARRQVYGEGEDDVEDDEPSEAKQPKSEAGKETSVSMTKGKLYFFSDTGIVAQKVKGGVLLWGRDDLAKGKSWHDADILVLLRLKDTSKIKKGMSGGGGWFKYVGMYRHGNLFVGYRNVPMFELPSKEEIAQAEYQQQEEEKQRRAEQAKQRRIQAEQRRFENEQRRIREAAEKEKRETEQRKLQEENDRRLAEEKRKLEEERRKRELEDEKRRQEQAKKDEEERKRRYPIEQKQRAEYAKVILSNISFDVNSYFDVQNDLKRFVYSAGVTEKNWSVLKDLQTREDWLGMLNVLSGNQMKDFPAQTQIEAIIETLKRTEFHAEFLFTHTDDKRHSGLHHRMCVGRVFPGERYHPIRWDYGHSSRGVAWNLDNASLIVPFSIQDGKNKFIHAEYPDPSGWGLLKKRDEQLNAISSEAKLGRITQSEAEERRRNAEDELVKCFSAWLNTSKVRDAHYPVRVRVGRAKSVVGVSESRTKAGDSNKLSKPKWTTCPDCNGSRYISKGRCDKCGGAGKYRTASVSGIGGRTIGGRMTQCDKCKGKGEIKELCKRCRGYGKIKQ